MYGYIKNIQPNTASTIKTLRANSQVFTERSYSVVKLLAVKPLRKKSASIVIHDYTRAISNLHLSV